MAVDPEAARKQTAQQIYDDVLSSTSGDSAPTVVQLMQYAGKFEGNSFWKDNPYTFSEWKRFLESKTESSNAPTTTQSISSTTTALVEETSQPSQSTPTDIAALTRTSNMESQESKTDYVYYTFYSLAIDRNKPDRV